MIPQAAAKLPFYPRSCGINYFYGRRREEQPPGTVVELCWVANGECVFDFGETRCTVKADQAIYRLPGDCRAKQVRQITTAVADGAVAALAACRYIDGR